MCSLALSSPQFLRLCVALVFHRPSFNTEHIIHLRSSLKPDCILSCSGSFLNDKAALTPTRHHPLAWPNGHAHIGASSVLGSLGT